MEWPEVIKHQLSINDKDVTKELVSNTLLKTTLIYIKKKISNTKKPSGISISISLFL